MVLMQAVGLSYRSAEIIEDMDSGEIVEAAQKQLRSNGVANGKLEGAFLVNAKLE